MRRAPGETGAAFTECVIAMPLLLMLFLSVHYFHQAYKARLEALGEARADGWTQRDQPWCGGGAARDVEDDQGLGTVVDGADPGGAVGEAAGDMGASMFTVRRAVVQRTQRAPAPRLFDAQRDGITEHPGKMVMTCNERNPTSLSSLMIQMFDSWVKPPW